MEDVNSLTQFIRVSGSPHCFEWHVSDSTVSPPPDPTTLCAYGRRQLQIRKGTPCHLRSGPNCLVAPEMARVLDSGFRTGSILQRFPGSKGENGETSL